MLLNKPNQIQTDRKQEILKSINSIKCFLYANGNQDLINLSLELETKLKKVLID